MPGVQGGQQTRGVWLLQGWRGWKGWEGGHRCPGQVPSRGWRRGERPKPAVEGSQLAPRLLPVEVEEQQATEQEQGDQKTEQPWGNILIVCQVSVTG